MKDGGYPIISLTDRKSEEMLMNVYYHTMAHGLVPSPSQTIKEIDTDLQASCPIISHHRSALFHFTTTRLVLYPQWSTSTAPTRWQKVRPSTQCAVTRSSWAPTACHPVVWPKSGKARWPMSGGHMCCTSQLLQHRSTRINQMLFTNIFFHGTSGTSQAD